MKTFDLTDTVRGWHFTESPTEFRGGRKIPSDGRWLVTREEPIMCQRGLHLSERAIDALKYAPGEYVYLVEAAGVVRGDDKCVARARRILARANATETLRHFARLCALDVIDKWDAPDVVRRWLETGYEQYRSAARSAAWSAAWSAAGSAGESAQNDRLTAMLMEVVK